MSDFAQERVAIIGRAGAAGVTIFTLSAVQRMRLETITFTLAASVNSTPHFPVVQFVDQSGLLITAIQDWNDVPDSAVVSYTFGIGLVAFCGDVTSGALVQNTLPDTVLEDQASVVLSSLDDAGNLIAADRFLEITLWGIMETTTASPDLIPLLTPLQLSGQTAA